MRDPTGYSKRSDPQKRNAQHEKGLPKRSGGLGFGAARGGDQRAQVGQDLDDTTVPGHQTDKAGGRDTLPPGRRITKR